MNVPQLNENVIRWVLPRMLAVVVAFAIPVLAYSAIGGITESRVFVVEAIDMAGNSALSEAQVLEAAGFAGPRNILTVSEVEVEQRLEAHPWIRHAEVAVNFRSRTVSMTVEERTLAAVAVGAHTLLIDTNGEVIEPWQAHNALTVPVFVGVPADDTAAMLEAISLSEQIQQTATAAENPVVEIHTMGAAGFRVLLANGFEIRVARDRIAERIAVLDAALDHARSRTAFPTYVYLTSTDPARAVIGQPSATTAQNPTSP